jgi:hypothetical protein
MLTTARGCGNSRTAGCLYLEVPTSPHGRPIEDFLICPPILPDFDLPTQGQLPFFTDGVLNLVDWIGECFYPNVCDWIEEARLLGISSKISIQFATSKTDESLTILESLTPASRLYFAHPRAFIHNIEDYRWGSFLNILPWSCPRSIEGHPETDPHESSEYGPPCCVGIYWWDLDGGEPVSVPEGVDMLAPERLVNRPMPCGVPYMGRVRPAHVEPIYSPAIFARFPVKQLALVRGALGEHEPVRERLAKLNLNIPLLEVDE